ncbi:hypothetical protein D9C73_016510 [Collichthys lucidus]|uniref:Uncharacterized protein n=1 Tax=Collichthys lucidus TaxID=240159 RepID=A0A4U5V565_COLLU|nr:hypothetical protein D9C73_016510 [Collichthys lucidus]
MAELLNHRRSRIQISMDDLVSALWRSLLPGQDFGQNHKLDGIFDKMNHSPELATHELCPYYFDQVTYSLPTKEQVKHSVDAIMNDLPPTCGMKGELQPQATLV